MTSGRPVALVFTPADRYLFEDLSSFDENGCRARRISQLKCLRDVLSPAIDHRSVVASAMVSPLFAFALAA